MDEGRRRRLRPWQIVYLGLVLVRCLLAFSPGYIHPDEWFQSGEVVAGDLLGMPTLRTWEFEPKRPIRSMASLRLLSLPLFALSLASRAFGFVPSARTIFAVQRLTALVLSFVIDASVFRLSAQRKAVSTLCLTAASSAILSFGVRPFSNAQESAILAACLVLLQTLEHRWSSARPISTTRLSLALGTLASVGLFTRFTFAIFAAPVAVSFLALAYRRGIQGSARRVVPCIVSFIGTSVAHIVLDSRYYGGGRLHVTPLNAALYNLQTSNLEQYGVHPRVLHAVVNAPMILGAGVYLIFLREVLYMATKRQAIKSFAMIEIVSALVAVFSLAALSAQPHQEPRFLLPLVTPVAVVISASRRRWGGRLIAFSLVQHLLVTLLFSIAHQAGIVPSLLQVNQDLLHDHQRPVELHFWRSFMPPRHLLLPPHSHATVQDHGSATASTMASALSHTPPTNDTLRLLFAPTWAVVTLNKDDLPFSPLYTFRPHLDMDHLGETVDAWRNGARSLTDSAAYEVVQLNEPVQREIKLQLT
ncbi:hypothetical protein FA10DRAFT_299006 [Acaromyces ingoldii]|uniref:Mannosyltransferase n=1 Tax=Acaromyces ingoldii TaxID=215250 RepID=A0A316YYC9_9BASI|nr:hypothetical protein FA10DRAFT_299006 [Acaromyces ingoldii]PWN93638.1 hypothetical protein FA10DRAFT_299006 [Acaromyces ingoldii]